MGRKKGSFYIEQEELIALVGKIQRREPDSMEALEKAFKGYLARYFHAKIPQYDKVAQENMIAETLYTAYGNIDQLKTPEAFVSWLRSMAHSQIYHYHKKREIQRRRDERETARQIREAERAKSREPELDLSNAEVRGAINKLPEKQRQALLLQMNGLKVKEIAERQGVSEGTVKSRLNYARIKLRKDGVFSREQ